MRILNPNNLKTIDYRIVKPLQDNLKDLDTANHDKLMRVLEKRGFTTPLFLWWDKGDFYLLDGHQRQRVMQLNEMRDESLPPDEQYNVPYVIIEADNVKAAKEMLLEITSQYGTITQDGLDEFVDLGELQLDELDVNFDALSWLEKTDEEDASDDKKPETDKVSRWTLEELEEASKRFVAETGQGDVMTFVKWLDQHQ